MKEIYIVLTYTGTILAKIVKFYTRQKFSHISISLDKDLNEMYSFGRLNPYNPFIGGFIHEHIDKGTFKRFKNTQAKIFSVEVTEEQYEKLRKNIEEMQAESEKYKFNIIGLFAVAFHKKIRAKNSFYCAEFVKYITEKSDINYNLPEIIKPEDFRRMKHKEEIYEGLLRNYNLEKRLLVVN